MTTTLYGRPGARPRPGRRALPVTLTLVALGAATAWALGGPGGLSFAAATSPTAPPPAATALSDDLRARFDAAASAAAAHGVDLRITSGWRSADEQQRLVAAAVATRGSEAEAHRWVLPPSRSAHVQGRAIDVGPPAGAAWLDAHGARFGLCRTYANESWHFEPAIDPGGTCPAMAPDSSAGW